MQPDLRRVGRMVAEEECVESKFIGEATGGHHPHYRIEVMRKGERLQAPADAIPESAHPRMTAVLVRERLGHQNDISLEITLSTATAQMLKMPHALEPGDRV